MQALQCFSFCTQVCLRSPRLEQVGHPMIPHARLSCKLQAMDKDGNGKLDTGEFRDAMQRLGGNLSGDSVSTIFGAMGITGYITLDQFLDIVEVRVRTCVNLLRACLQLDEHTCCSDHLGNARCSTCAGSQGIADAWQLLFSNCLGNGCQLTWLRAATLSRAEVKMQL